MNRRSFIQNGALAGVALAVPVAASTQPKQEPLKWRFSSVETTIKDAADFISQEMIDRLRADPFPDSWNAHRKISDSIRIFYCLLFSEKNANWCLQTSTHIIVRKTKEFVVLRGVCGPIAYTLEDAKLYAEKRDCLFQSVYGGGIDNA